MVKLAIAFTFANHMHWVDMEWLWGYDVLPGSVRDMLAYCEATGAKGNVNFDGIGYEKLATEDPEAFALLRDAVQSGLIEIVGGSFGQPYGLFHGGESNIRQRVYGVRTCLRLFGVRPVTFWEEEFDFFPQLPQILSGCGYRNASLFFQWTWHTPEIPFEDSPAIWWEGQDGTRLLTATRNKLNLHQWPEDIDAILESGLPSLDSEESGRTSSLDSRTSTLVPLIQQWVELMPSPDWMCRSEVLIPPMKKLLADERFEFRFQTLGEYLDDVRRNIGSQRTPLPVRHYTMDDVWHGMSLGKNGDNMRRRSFEAECELLSAETLAAVLGLFGRPYAQWDVYPTWVLEEAWRELLTAQHHDNDECEGLCGDIARPRYEAVTRSAMHITERHAEHSASRAIGYEDSIWVFNPLGWERSWHVVHRAQAMAVVDVPAFGWTCISETSPDADAGEWVVEGRIARFRRGQLEVDLNLDTVTVTHFANSAFPEGLAPDSCPLWKWVGTDAQGEAFSLKGRGKWWRNGDEAPQIVGSRLLRLPVEFEGHPDQGMTIHFACEPYHEGLEVTIQGWAPRPKPGLNSAFGWEFEIARQFARTIADQPYGVNELQPNGSYLRKYPEGDWMTSPQWFEEITNPFTGNSFVDFCSTDGAGLFISFNGSRQWFREKDGSARHVLHAYDPWDESQDRGDLESRFVFLPHKELRHHERWKLSQEFQRECVEEPCDGSGNGLPSDFNTLSCHPSNVIPTALHREEESFASKGLSNYAGKGMGHPYILRLVEFDGIETEAELSIVGPVARAYKTNLMGEVDRELVVEEDSADENGWPRARIRVPMRPFEIATLYLDIIPGRKQTRDLDAKRVVWATVHRQ